MHARNLWLGLVLGATLAVAGPQTERELDAALRGLNHPEPLTRLRAQWALETVAAEGAAPALLKRLEQHEKLRAESVSCMLQVLGELGVDRALETFKHLAAHGKRPEIQVSAAIGLARLHSDAGRQALAELVRQRDVPAPIKRLCLVALGMSRDPAVVELSQALIASSAPDDRRAAYRALGYCAAKGALDRVKHGLNDRDPLVSSRAAWALAKLKGEEFVPRLAKLVDRMPRGGQRFMLLDALARLGVEGALAEVISRVQNPRDPQQYEAALTISETSERRAAPALRHVLKQHTRQPKEVVAIAIFALGKLGDQRAVPLLLRVLKKGALEHKRLAAEALGVLQNGDAERALLSAAGSRDLELRVQALVALSQLRGRKQPAKLKRLLSDRDPVVRYFAAVALEGSGNEELAMLLEPLRSDREPFVRAAAQQAHAVLNGSTPPAVDARDPKLLDRFHALEREYALGAGAAYTRKKQQSFEGALREIAYAATCGGTHPPVITPELLKAIEGQLQEREIARMWREQLDASYVLRRARTRLEDARRRTTRVGR